MEAIASNGKTAQIERVVLRIKALDGSVSIAKSTDLFSGYIDNEIKKRDGTKIGVKTNETDVCFRVSSGVTLLNGFSEERALWSKKVLSENQVVEFSKSIPEIIKNDRSATVACLCKKNEFALIDEENPWKHLFVVEIDFNSRGNPVYVASLKYPNPVSKFIMVLPVFIGSHNSH